MARDDQIRIRVSTAEKRAIEKAADAADLTVLKTIGFLTRKRRRKEVKK